MENANNKQANEIHINFNNENYEFDHDYTKPFSRSKSILVKHSHSKDYSIHSETYKSKKTNRYDESFTINNIKKEFYKINEEYYYHKTNFTKNILAKEFIEQGELINLFSFAEKQNILLKVRYLINLI
jgi:hypothetical protein